MTLAFNQRKSKSVYHFILRLNTYYNRKKCITNIKLKNKLLLSRNLAAILSVSQLP